MKAFFHKNFSKSYQRLPAKAKKQFEKRLKLFLEDPSHVLLNNHALHGEWKNYRSINIAGNLRAIYKPIDDDAVKFVIIDTHSNLYS